MSVRILVEQCGMDYSPEFVLNVCTIISVHFRFPNCLLIVGQVEKHRTQVAKVVPSVTN